MSDKPVVGKVVFGGKHEPELHMPDIDCTYCKEKDRRIAELEARLEAVKELPGKWREVDSPEGWIGYDECADELEAALNEVYAQEDE